MDDEEAQQLLDLPLASDNDAGAGTVGEYLIRLLHAVWRDREDFSGKRPFGMSGWPYNLYAPMVKAGLVAGSLDGDGYVHNVDVNAADALVRRAITELGRRG